MATAKVVFPDSAPTPSFKERKLLNEALNSGMITSMPNTTVPMPKANKAATTGPSDLVSDNLSFIVMIPPYFTGAIFVISAPNNPATAAVANARIRSVIAIFRARSFLIKSTP